MAQIQNTQIAGSSTSVTSGDAVFNMIMSKIEPELTTDVFPTLDAKYAGETPEQKTAREEKYKKAFAEFEKQFNAYMTKMESEIHTLQRTLIEALEAADTATDEHTLGSVESQLAAA